MGVIALSSGNGNVGRQTKQLEPVQNILQKMNDSIIAQLKEPFNQTEHLSVAQSQSCLQCEHASLPGTRPFESRSNIVI